MKNLHDKLVATSYYDFIADRFSAADDSHKGYAFKRYTVRELEEEMARLFGVKYAIAASSGTTALIVSLKALGVEGKKIAIPSFSFIAPAFAATLNGAEIIFADVDDDTLCLDIDKTLGGSVLPDLILPVHIGGLSCNMDELSERCAKLGIDIVEDAAQALGTMHNGRRLGTFGKAAIFSFGKSKIPTAGEGGLILTDDPSVAEKCSSIINYGRISPQKPYVHAVIGYNGKMSEIQASLILSQMDSIGGIVDRRYSNAMYLQNALQGLRGIRLIKPRWNEKCNFYMFMIQYKQPEASYPTRDELVSALSAKGVPVNSPEKFPFAIYHNPCYSEVTQRYIKNCPVSEKVYEEIIVVGHPGQSIIFNLEQDYMDAVVSAFREILR